MADRRQDTRAPPEGKGVLALRRGRRKALAPRGGLRINLAERAEKGSELRARALELGS